MTFLNRKSNWSLWECLLNDLRKNVTTRQHVTQHVRDMILVSSVVKRDMKPKAAKNPQSVRPHDLFQGMPYPDKKRNPKSKNWKKNCLSRSKENHKYIQCTLTTFSILCLNFKSAFNKVNIDTSWWEWNTLTDLWKQKHIPVIQVQWLKNAAHRRYPLLWVLQA